ncbi:MAG TPA: diacylglycerol kinase family protein [Chitinophagaceae bacterium]|jgi:YegS/Rv2252/BmrU family lipid kinase|nr:diacylglycerol kinase family protein [Chitinophagaceae bacterium]
MQKDEPQKLLFVINPVSGGKEKTDWEVSIREYFKDQPHSIEFYLLTGQSDTTSVQLYIERIQPHKVIAVGGDGTVKMVAELTRNTSIALGILPAGSANGMAKELGIPATKNEALNVVLNGEEKSIDAIEVNDKEMCLHLSDIGLNAMLVKYFEDSEKRGMWGYMKGVVKMLRFKQKMYATIVTDEGTFYRKAYMVVLANARQYGTGATINPEGELDDGKFEIVVVRRLNFWGLLNMLITHKAFHPEKVEIFSTRKAEIKTLRSTYFQVDGEYRNRTSSVSASVLPRCIRIMLPPSNNEVA